MSLITISLWLNATTKYYCYSQMPLSIL
jgi:hypothetical protein